MVSIYAKKKFASVKSSVCHLYLLYGDVEVGSMNDIVEVFGPFQVTSSCLKLLQHFTQIHVEVFEEQLVLSDPLAVSF